MTHIEYSAVQAENDVLRSQNRRLKEKEKALRELIEEECEIVTVPSYNGTPIEEEVVPYKKLIEFLDNYGKEYEKSQF